MESERLNYRKELTKKWAQHIAIVSKMTANDYWNITPTELLFSHPNFQFSVVFLTVSLTKLDIEDDTGHRIWRSYPSFKGRIDQGIDTAE